MSTWLPSDTNNRARWWALRKLTSYLRFSVNITCSKSSFLRQNLWERGTWRDTDELPAQERQPQPREGQPLAGTGPSRQQARDCKLSGCPGYTQIPGTRVITGLKPRTLILSVVFPVQTWRGGGKGVQGCSCRKRGWWRQSRGAATGLLCREMSTRLGTWRGPSAGAEAERRSRSPLMRCPSACVLSSPRNSVRHAEALAPPNAGWLHEHDRGGCSSSRTLCPRSPGGCVSNRV